MAIKGFLRSNILVILTIILVIIPLNLNFNCGFDKYHEERRAEGRNVPSYHYDVNESGLEKNKTHFNFLQDVAFQPIRISVDYTNIENASTDATWVNNIKKFIGNSANLYSQILQVRPLSSILKVNANDCKTAMNTLVIPDSLVNVGLNVDLILIATIDPSLKQTDTTEAWASYCKLEASSNRPVVGIVALSKFALNFSKKNWLDYYTSLVFHEIYHVIVFNNDYYDKFYDATTNTVKPSSSIVISNQVVNGIPRTLIKSTAVIQAAKKHYSCDNVAGVELENQGGDGSAGAHWESRVMLGDFMMAESFEETFLSEISCALAEDSGWYKVNCYSGGLFRFGKGAGCGFLNQKCIQNQQAQFKGFCDQNGQALCMRGKKARGTCQIQADATFAKELAAQPNYQYFTDKTLGGYRFADFCPIAESASDKTHFSGSCVYGEGNKSIPYESLSVISGCFEANLTVSKASVSLRTLLDSFSSANPLPPTCYKYICDRSKVSIRVQISNDLFVECPGNEGYLQVNGFSGKIYCPEFNEFCPATSDCYSLTDCIEKKSTLASPTTLKPNDNTAKINTDSAASTGAVGPEFNVPTTPTSSDSNGVTLMITNFIRLFAVLFIIDIV